MILLKVVNFEIFAYQATTLNLNNNFQPIPSDDFHYLFNLSMPVAK